jgi:predicted ribosome quality control (RQC) complex YloA/Tae2 family protein
VSLNWKEIDAVLAELPLKDSHIQKVFQPDFQSLVFQVYSPEKRFYLLIHLGPGRTRLHEIGEKPERTVKLQRFAQFLRSRVVGARIIEAYQVSSERIVKLTAVRGGETLLIWIRLWGNAANVIVTDEDCTILDAFYRRPNRGEVSGGTYDPDTEFGMKGGDPSGKKDKYTVRDLPGEDSFNRKLDRYYRETQKQERLEGLRTAAGKINKAKESRISSQIRNMQNRFDSYGQFETYKEYGDLITNSIHMMKPGDKWLKACNYFRDNQPVEIELDPTKTPAENAEMYYRKYRKTKSGYERLQEELKTQRKKLEECTAEKEEIENTEDVAFLENYIKQNEEQRVPPKEEKELPGLQFRSGDFTIYVGRNAKESDEILRRHVRGNDYWLHTRDYPGGYVFIKYLSGKSVPLPTLLDAGNLAVYYSKGRKEEKAELYYTQVKYLRRAKHGKLGTVIPTQEKNISIELDEDRINRLLSQQSHSN